MGNIVYEDIKLATATSHTPVGREGATRINYPQKASSEPTETLSSKVSGRGNSQTTPPNTKLPMPQVSAILKRQVDAESKNEMPKTNLAMNTLSV